MPLRVLDNLGRSLHAFELNDAQWEETRRANRAAYQLRMPCCKAPVILKVSRYGTRFFAHKSRLGCLTAPEGEEHLQLKWMAVDAAKAHGWSAETEASGISPDGEEWRADVLATRGKHTIAIEVQWSAQSVPEIQHRQQRYRRSGIRGLWLLRQPGFPISKDLPSACIGGNAKDGFVALLPDTEIMHARDRKNPRSWRQIIPMDEFLNAAFNSRLHFGIPSNVLSWISVLSTWTKCWNAACRVQTRIITAVRLIVGPDKFYFSISEIAQYPSLLRLILNHLPRDGTIGAIKRRYSRTMEGSYTSNGCRRCDRLVGEFFVQPDAENEVLAVIDNVPLCASWYKLINNKFGNDRYWTVYDLTQLDTKNAT